MAVLPTGLQSRPMFIQNTETEETMPAFGVGAIVSSSPLIAKGNQILYPVRKVTENDVLRASTEFIFNGPQAIPPGKDGVGTQDYPCRALVTGNSDRRDVKAGSWELVPRGAISGVGSFASLGQDPTDPLGKDKIVDFVRPSPGPAYADALRCTSSSVDPAEKLSLASVESSGSMSFSYRKDITGFGPTDHPLVGMVVNSDGLGFKFVVPGIWFFSFSGTVRPVEKLAGQEGRSLAVTFYREEEATDYTAYRRHFVDDNEGYGTEGESGEENIAFSGVVLVRDTEVAYSLRSTGDYPGAIVVSSGRLVGFNSGLPPYDGTRSYA